MSHDIQVVLMILGYGAVGALALGVFRSQLDKMNRGLEAKGLEPIDIGTMVFAALIWPVSLLIIIGQWVGERVLGK